MNRRELKYRAMMRIQTVRPNPCLVALAVLVFGWLITWMSQRIGGQPLYMDLDAVEAMDYEHFFGWDWGNVSLVSSLFLIAFEIVSLYVNFGYTKYCLNVCREEKSGFGDLLSGFEYTWRVVVLWLLTRIVVTLLSFLLIVPGIIAAYAYSMANRILCDHPDWSPIRCMRESRQRMKGHKWELFVLELSFIGWFFLTMIPVASVFVKPYVSLTETEFYLRLMGGDKSEPASDESDGEDRPPWEY